MNKTSFIKTLVIATLMFAVFPSHSSAEHKMGSYFQAVVLSQEQSPELDLRVGRYSMRKATVNVSSVVTGKPINRVKIFSMIRSGEVFFLGETNRKGNLNFKNGYKHVMQLQPRDSASFASHSLISNSFVPKFGLLWLHTSYCDHIFVQKG